MNNMKKYIALLMMGILLSASLLSGCGLADKVKSILPKSLVKQEQTADVSSAAEPASNPVVNAPSEEPASEPEEPAQQKVVAEEDENHIALNYDQEWDSDWSDEYSRLLSQMRCEMVFLAEDSAARYPELNQAVTEYCREKLAVSKDLYTLYAPDAPAEYERAGEDFHYFYVDVQYALDRADSKYFSLMSRRWAYAGGMHYEEVWSSAVWESATGKMLSVDDVLTDRYAMGQKVSEALDQKYPRCTYPIGKEEALACYFGGDLAPMDTPLRDPMFSLGYEGIIFYFNAYDIASWGDGTLSVIIPYAGNEGLLKGDYSAANPDSYTIPGLIKKDFNISLENDQKFDSIVIENREDDYETLVEMYGYLNNEEFVIDENLYAFDMRPTLIHTNGKNYIYVEMSEENDYREISVLELNRSGIREVERCYNLDVCMTTTDEGGYYSKSIANPDCIQMESRTELISTVGGIKWYYVSDDGTPKSHDEFYRVSYEMFFTLNKDFMLTTVDPADPSNQKKIPYKKGDTFEYISTDDSRYAVLKDPNGLEIMLEIQNNYPPQLVDGTDLTDLFDGIVFAG